MGTAYQPVLLQHVQIAPHGLLGDPEVSSELSDVHGSRTACRFQNPASSLLGVHGDTSVSRLRAVSVPHQQIPEALPVRAFGH
jgi:hypothetical protein